jgi:hypothetical protein
MEASPQRLASGEQPHGRAQSLLLYMAPIAATLLLPFTMVLEGNVISRVMELAAEEPCSLALRCLALNLSQYGWREAVVCWSLLRGETHEHQSGSK